MEYSKFVVSILKDDYTYLFNTKNNLSLKVENRLLDKIKIDEDTAIQFKTFLESKRFFPEDNELENMINIFKERDNSSLRLIILVHGDCNFRCKYCYEKFENCSISDNVTNIVEFARNKIKQNNFKNLHISWFGGEPLLGYQEILNISEKLMILANEHGLIYTADMTTNGYLLNGERLKKLVHDCKVTAYQITIDGAKEGHDYQRVLKNGGGSYNKILDNLIVASKTDLNFKITIRMNISQENYKYIEEFLVGDAQKFKNDKRFNFSFQNVGDWGCGDRDNDYNVNIFNEDVALSFSIKALKMGFKLYDNFILNNYMGCYAQRKNSYVIDTKGNLLKCTVALYNDENKIGTLVNAYIDDEKHNLWINHYDFNSKCLDCKFLLICKGGACPKRETLNEVDFHTECFNMQQKILKSIELVIISRKINYELKVD